MFYCPGEFCSKKNECLHHKLKNSKCLIQLLDMSTQGHGFGGFDKNGKYYNHHEFECGDRAPTYRAFWKYETWQDKCDFENTYNPAQAEGLPCPPGTEILIENEKGEPDVIMFNPKTLKLSTKVLDWHYSFKL